MRTLVKASLAVALLFATAPADAQQFSFLTGDRSLQPYGTNARAYNNDGTQGGGLATGASTTSSYQAGFAPGQDDQASNGQGGAGGAGGMGSTGRTVGGTGVAYFGPGRGTIDGGPLVTTSTLDGQNGGGSSAGGRYGALANGMGQPGRLDGVGGQGSGGGSSGGPGAAGAGGKGSAVIGTLPQGVIPPTNVGGCPPFCGGAGGRGSAIMPVDTQARLATLGGLASGGGGPGGQNGALDNKYNFKFTTPVATVVPTPGPGPGPVTSVAGHNVSLGVNQLRTLQSVPNLQSLSAIKQKN